MSNRKQRREAIELKRKQQEQQRKDEYMRKPIFIYKSTSSTVSADHDSSADNFYEIISAKLVNGKTGDAHNRNITIRHHPYSRSNFVFITRNDDERTVQEKPIQTCSTISLNATGTKNTILELDDEIIFIQGWSISLFFSKPDDVPDDLRHKVIEQAYAEIRAANVAAAAASTDDDDDEPPQFAPTIRIRLT